MHVILATVGTDGDVFPHLGLGCALRARGHRVTLAGPEHREQARELYPLLKSKDEETAYRTAFVLGIR